MAGMEYAIVSAAESNRIPYPYVYVTAPGFFRELTADEREYLQTPFHPADGARPYVKNRYEDLTPDGRIIGFLRRDKLPLTVRLQGR